MPLFTQTFGSRVDEIANWHLDPYRWADKSKIYFCRIKGTVSWDFKMFNKNWKVQGLNTVRDAEGLYIFLGFLRFYVLNSSWKIFQVLGSLCVLLQLLLIICGDVGYYYQNIDKSWSARFCTLKVPSGQIGSTWKWYHWIGLEKDINCYRLLIF